MDQTTRKIEDYGIIGNMRTAALIDRDASMSWLCLPRFDSDACCAALLGNEDNGHNLSKDMPDHKGPVQERSDEGA